MYADTIDTGATISVLRAFGPPDVVPLDDLAGNAAVELGADGFWTVVKAVSLELAAAAAVADRFCRLTWSADGESAYAQALAAYPIEANHTGQVTFAVGVQQAGALNGPTIITPMPELVLLPGWTLTLDVVAGAAADALTGVRAYLQRYELVELEQQV